MRTRSKEDKPEVQALSIVGRYRGPTWEDPPSVQSGFFIQELGQRMVDRKTPGFFRAKREGGVIPVSPMNSTLTKCIIVPGSSQASWYNPGTNGNWQRRTLDVTGVAMPREAINWLAARRPFDQVVSPDQALLQSALARAQTDAWDTATFLAELGKTVQSFTTLHGRVMRLYSDFQRKLFQKKHWNPETAASLWLEMRYTWRPMLYDMQDISKAINRLAEGLEEPLCRGWANGEGSPRAETSPPFSSQLAMWKGTLSQSLNPSGSAIGIGGTGVRPKAVASVISETRKRATVGVQVTTRVATMVDPFVTAWELVPYSFILDWVITVGDIIAAFSPFATGHFRYATYSLETTTELRIDGSCSFEDYSSNLKLESASPFASVYSMFYVQHTRVEASVTPTLAIQLNFDWAKILDLVALAISLRFRFINPGSYRPPRPPRPPRYRPPRPRNLPPVRYVPPQPK